MAVGRLVNISRDIPKEYDAEKLGKVIETVQREIDGVRRTASGTGFFTGDIPPGATLVVRDGRIISFRM